MRIPPTCFAMFSIHFSINCNKNEVRKVQFRADEQRKSIKRLRQQTRLVQYTFCTVVAVVVGAVAVIETHSKTHQTSVTARLQIKSHDAQIFSYASQKVKVFYLREYCLRILCTVFYIFILISMFFFFVESFLRL